MKKKRKKQQTNEQMVWILVLIRVHVFFTSQGWDLNIISCFDFTFKLEWKSVQNGAFVYVDGLANVTNAVSAVYVSVAIIFS